MLRSSRCLRGWHYVHPKNGRPLQQARRYGDPRYINNEAATIKGTWGLITSDFGVVTPTQLENARLEIMRRVPRARFRLEMMTDYEEYPMNKRPAEARFGRGKAPITHFAYKFTTGVPLFELYPTHEGQYPLTQTEAEVMFLTGRMVIPLETKVVPRGRVNEYEIFK